MVANECPSASEMGQFNRYEQMMAGNECKFAFEFEHFNRYEQ